MRLVALDRAPYGVELARDVRSGMPGDVPLLRAGTGLTRAYGRRLRELGIRAVWIEDAATAGIEPLPPLDDDVRREAEERVADVVDGALGAVRTGCPVPGAVTAPLSDLARVIARHVASLPEAAYALEDLASADAYTHRHSVQVAVLGLLLADRHWRRWGWVDWQGHRRYDRLEERLARLGFGLLVHDIGKLVVPDAILHKPAALDEDEWEVMRSHAEAGVRILEPAGASPLVLDVVRSHHERLDGSGYPNGLVGGAIHQFARIAAIADTYDAIVSERAYQPGRPPHVALNILRADTPHRYDPDLMATFCRVAVPFPVGTEVPVPDGGSGVVADADVLDPWKPIVRLACGGEQVVDLSSLDEHRVPVAG